MKHVSMRVASLALTRKTDLDQAAIRIYYPIMSLDLEGFGSRDTQEHEAAGSEFKIPTGGVDRLPLHASTGTMPRSALVETLSYEDSINGYSPLRREDRTDKLFPALVLTAVKL